MKYSQWKKFNVVGESILDAPRPEGLDPAVWRKVGEGWILSPAVELQIKKISDWLKNSFGLAFSDVHVIGSICSNCWTPGCDVDVHFVCPGLDPAEQEPFNKRVKDAFETGFALENPDVSSIGGHPLEIYVQASPWKSLASAGCWDVVSRKWLVGPRIRPEGFDPYASFWDADMESQAGQLLPEIRGMVFQAWEKAVAVLRTKDPVFEKRMSDELVQCLQTAVGVFERLKTTRRLTDGITSAEDAVAMRDSREWETADSSFKLFVQFGYVPALKACKTALKSGLSGKALARVVATSFQKSFADRIPADSEGRLDEGWRSAVAGAAMLGAALVGGQASGQAAINLPEPAKCTAQQKIQRQKYFDAFLTDVTPEQKQLKFDGKTFEVALAAVSDTLFGEARQFAGKSGAAQKEFDMISDSIVNRCSSVNDLLGVCLARRRVPVKNKETGKKEMQTFCQYSYWNNNLDALQKIQNGSVMIPGEVDDNPLERRAFGACVARAKEMLLGKYKAKTNVNSYYKKSLDAKGKAPYWAPNMTDVKTESGWVHKFGYVKTNDPKFVNMTTLHSVKRPDPVKKTLVDYKVKSGDTLSQIAVDNKTTVSKILADNPHLKSKDMIRVGMVLKV